MRLFILLSAAVSLLTYPCTAQVSIPAASPGAKIVQNIGMAEFTVEYSRPSTRNRKIMSGLVPYGKLWRMGANAPTKLSATRAFTIAGKTVEAGSYNLFTIIDKTGWTLIISKRGDYKSANNYEEKDDLHRITVPIHRPASFIETFTIGFEHLTVAGVAKLVMEWEHSRAVFDIKQDYEAEVMDSISSVMSREPGFRDYFNAATFYLDHNKDPKQADEWALKAAEMNPAYWTWHLRAKTAAKTGNKKAATEAAYMSISMAKESGNTEAVETNRKLLDSLK